MSLGEREIFKLDISENIINKNLSTFANLFILISFSLLPP